MAFNKDEMHPPHWMEESFFQTVLRRSEKDAELRVIRQTIIPGSKPGEHYASIIFRSRVIYESRGQEREISLIIKAIPDQDGMKLDLLKDGVLFETEIAMYDTVLGRMHQMFQSVGFDTTLAPRLLYSSTDPYLVMVFEDLCPQGYSMKTVGASLNEAKIIFLKLARLHAASMVLAEADPSIKNFNNGFGNLDLGKFIEIWRSHFTMVGELCQEWPGYEKYTCKMEKLKDTVFDRIKEIYTLDDSTLYCVLNHGDLHFKNMMFKIEEGVTKDVMLLDYQISVWGTPAIDILYSLHNTLSVDTRDNHREELIRFYYDKFIEALTKLGYSKKHPSLVDLRVELTKCGHLETLVSLVFLPFMVLRFDEMMQQEPDQKPEDGVEMDFTKMVGSYRHPTVVAILKRYIPLLNNKGLLD